MSTEAKSRARYNKIMFELGMEHRTIGTDYSENTYNWGIAEMVNECKYQLDMHYSSGTSYADMRYDDDLEIRKQWKSEVGKLSRFIKAYESNTLIKMEGK